MKLSQFKFKLPEEKIALYPAKYRDESRLMVLHKTTGEIEHKVFKDILGYFDDKDVFIFNDTKVFPARLYGNKEKTGARIEVFLLRELNEELRLWDVLVDPARKIRIGNKLYFGEDDSMVAEVIDNTTSRGRTLRFLYDGPHEEFKKALYALGETPLPHTIIKRPVEEEDAERFQSIFARKEGAVTAPTANLHFSRELMKRLEIKGIDFAFVTMHAGLGNFRDIDVEDLTKHKMDSEQMFVNEMAVKQGVIPDPLQGTVGNLSAQSYYEAVNQLRRLKGEAEITAVARTEVSSIGPLTIDILIRPILAAP